MEQQVEMDTSTISRKRSWYMILLLSLSFGMAELSHFLVGTTTRLMAQDLHYGDQSCMNGPNASARIAAHVTCSSYSNATACLWEDSGCVWDYNGQGIAYQILAGPSFILVYCAGCIVMGLLCRRYDRIVIFACSTLLFSVCTCLTGWAQEFWQLIVLRFGLAFGESAIHPVSTSLLPSLFPSSLHGTAMGVINFGIYFGYGLSYIVGTYIPPLDIGGQGWRAAYYLASIPGPILALLMLGTTSDPRKHGRQQSDDQRKDSVSLDSPQQDESIWKGLGYFFTPSVLVLCFASCVRQIAGFSWSYNSKLYHDTYYPDFDIGLYLFFTSVIGGSVGMIVGGAVSDGIVKKVGVQARAWVLAVSQLVATPCAAGVLLLPPPYSFICLLAAYTFADMWMGIMFAILIKMVPKHHCSFVVGVFIFIMNNVGGNLPVAIDPLAKLIGYRQALYIFYPGALLLSAVIFGITGLVLRRRE